MISSPARAIFLGNDASQIERVFGRGRREHIEKLIPCAAGVLGAMQVTKELGPIEAIFSTWGMPALDADTIARLPHLRDVYYAAGSVQGFARPFLDAGVRVHSAWAANAIPVAEAAVAHILLALKGTFAQARIVREDRDKDSPRRPVVPGCYGARVGLVGLGQIGRRVLTMLRSHRLEVVAHDPYAPADLGVALLPLADLFATSTVVSVHLPWTKETEGSIGPELLRKMPAFATLLNTARGAVIRENGLWDVLCERPDLTAILDVVWPEPPAKDSRMWDLPNVMYTPHICGSLGDEVLRMADMMIEELERTLRGEAPLCAIDRTLLEVMA